METSELLKQCTAIQSRFEEDKYKQPINWQTSSLIATWMVDNDDNWNYSTTTTLSSNKLWHKKHLEVGDSYDDMSLQGPMEYVDPIIFESIRNVLLHNTEVIYHRL